MSGSYRLLAWNTNTFTTTLQFHSMFFRECNASAEPNNMCFVVCRLLETGIQAYWSQVLSETLAEFRTSRTMKLSLYAEIRYVCVLIHF